MLDSYSLRILSPFGGTTRIIQHQFIRAISNDGVHWRIQIQVSQHGDAAQNRYILFGLWTVNELSGAVAGDSCARLVFLS